MPSELVAAWRRSSGRIDSAAEFIDHTTSIEKSAREQVYASRVLLLYGACQYAVQELGLAALKVLSEGCRSPRDLPARVRKEHLGAALQRIPTEDAAEQWEEIRAALAGMVGVEWSKHTGLHQLDGNVWPDKIVAYCRRFSQSDPDFEWMRDTRNAGGETLNSRLRNLVAERNPIAHGYLEPNVLSAELMKEWAEDCKGFLERVYLTVAVALFQDLARRTPRIGQRDRAMVLGNRTVALREVFSDFGVGDFVILRRRGSEEPRGATVLSIMSNGVSLRTVQAGATRVAVQLSREIGRSALYLAP